MRRYIDLFRKNRHIKTLSLAILCLLVVVVPIAFFLGQKIEALTHNSSSQTTVSSQSFSVYPHSTPGQTPPSKPTLNTSPTVRPTPTSTFGNMGALPPGSTLPTEAQCAARVSRSSWEPRPDNTLANHRVPTAQQLASMELWNTSTGYDPMADSLRQQITGNYTGTTDQILQWVACKWGLDVNLVRAEAVVESYWHQNQQGDITTNQSLCPPGTWNGTNCYQSYGILQIKYIYNKGEWPMSRDDTAFSAEYMYGVIRACYEGWTTYLSSRTPLPGYPAYQAGDIWGCVGRWFSGGWYDQGALNYINEVKAQYTNKIWLNPGF